MASAIGDLVIRVNSQTRGAERGLDRLRARQRGYRRETQRSSEATRAFHGALQRLAAVVGIGVLLRRAFQGVREEFQLLDDVAKRSRGFGMAGRELYGLQFALRILGVESERTEKAIFRMLRNIGEVAARGIGEAKPTFEALGLDPAELARLPVSEQLYRVMDALSGVATQAERAHHAGELFGRGAMKLITPLTEYKETLRSLIEEGENLGDNLTGENLERIQQFNDMWTRVGMGWRRIKQDAAILTTQIMELAAATVRFGGALDHPSFKMVFGPGVPSAVTAMLGYSARAGAGKWREKSPEQPDMPATEEELSAQADAIERVAETTDELRRRTEALGLSKKTQMMREFTSALEKEGITGEDAARALREHSAAVDEFLEKQRKAVEIEAPRAGPSQALGRAREVLREWRAEAEMPGLDARDRMIEEFARTLSMEDYDVMKGLRLWDHKLDEIERKTRASTFADDLRRDLETPPQRALRELEELQARAREFGTPQALVDAKARQIYEQLRDELKDREEGEREPALQFAGAAQRGTAEAYSAILQGMSAMQGQRDKTEQNTEATARNTKESAQSLDEIMREVRGLREDQDEGMDIPGG